MKANRVSCLLGQLFLLLASGIAQAQTITQQPVSRAVSNGVNVTFTVAATGTGPLRYQWQFNDSPLAGATNASLTLTNVQLSQAGNYNVGVSDDVGSVLSETAVLTVLARPVITIGPTAGSPMGGTNPYAFVAIGGNATFFIEARGTLPMSFRWRRAGITLTRGVIISTASNSTLTVTNVTPTDATNYTCVVTNVAGQAPVSPQAFLIITNQCPSNPPVVRGTPQSRTVIAGTPATFTVGASSCSPVSYQWQFNGANLPDQTNAVLTFPNPQPADAGDYSVVVRNDSGSVTSAPAALNVTVALALNTIGSGAMVANPSQASYSPNSLVNLTAVPNPGWVFAGWTGDASGTNNPLAVLMTTNKVITANFMEAPISAGCLGFASLSYQVNENGGGALVTVVRTGGAAGAVSVDYSALDGTAVAGLDYIGVSGTLFFADGETSRTFVVPILDDALFEGNESVILRLTNAAGGATLCQNVASLEIIDDESAPGCVGFASAFFNVAEGSATAIITVQRMGNSQGPLSVQFTTMAGTATAGLDYIDASGTLTFAAGETNQTIIVPIIDDLIAEPNETVFLRLTNATGGATLCQDVATLTIVDNEFPRGCLGFSATSYSVNENGGSASITVLRTGGSAGIVSVDYSTLDGTALAGLDYSAVNGTLLFADGETNKTLVVPIVDDLLFEGNESVILRLTNAAGGATLCEAVASLEIIDDEPPGCVGFAGAFYNIVEGPGTAAIIVQRTGNSQGPVSVQFFTLDGTATSGLDYTGANGTLTFAPGETNKFIIFTIFDDFFLEADETVFMRLTNATGGAALCQDAATLTIQDDEFRRGCFEFAAASYSVGEGAGSLTITVQRTDGNVGAVTVDYATLDATASAGLDYVATSGTLSFADGQMSKTFVLPILDDALVEGNESLVLRLTNPTGGAAICSNTATVLIVDDEEPSCLSFAMAVFSVSEGNGNALIEVQRVGGSQGTVSVDYSTLDGTAIAGVDYVSVNGVLDFAPGETTKAFSVPILDNGLVQTNRNLRLLLSNSTGGATLCSNTATLWIVDDENARGIKESVLADLMALRATIADDDDPDAHRLDEAIEHLSDSLNPLWWVDDSHLDRKKGDKVFHEEKEAAHKLRELTKDKKSNIPDAVLLAFINRIVQADRLLAVLAIDEAEAAGLNPKKVAEDRAQVAKGDQDAANGKPEEAIEHYRHAWKHAIHLKIMPPRPTAGGLRLGFIGLAGEMYVIQSSSNLVDWTTLGTATSGPDGSIELDDPDAATQPARFYRVMQP